MRKNVKTNPPFPALLGQASRDDGPFSDHLKRILVSVSRLPSVADYARHLLTGHPAPDQDAFYRLLAAGIVRQGPDGRPAFRCELYRQYLEQHLP